MEKTKMKIEEKLVELQEREHDIIKEKEITFLALCKIINKLYKIRREIEKLKENIEKRKEVKAKYPIQEINIDTIRNLHPYDRMKIINTRKDWLDRQRIQDKREHKKIINQIQNLKYRKKNPDKIRIWSRNHYDRKHGIVERCPSCNFRVSIRNGKTFEKHSFKCKYWKGKGKNIIKYLR